MKTTGKLLAATAMVTLVSGATAAQDLEALKKQLEELSKKVEALETKTATVSKSEPAMAFKSSDGNFEMNLRGRIYVDGAWVSDDNGTMDIAETEFRTARLGIEGKAWKKVKYKFEADFGGDEVEVKDAYLQYGSDAGKFTFGQFKQALSLDEQTSSRHIAFMERASFTDAFSYARQIGIGYSNGGDNWTAGVGIFRGDNGDGGDGQLTIAGRATYGGKMDNGVWMVGASARMRDGNGSNFRYRQRPHQHLSDRFVFTDRLSDEDTTYGIEGAATFGSFWVSGEMAALDSNGGGAMGRDARMWGGYVDAGFFITGESRPLKLDKGAWDRPKVNKPVHEGGAGAWAVAVRYDKIDLTSDGVYGGEQDTLILGVNWYLNRHTRFMANYNYSSIDRMGGPNDGDGKNSVDGLGLRFQVDW